ncbi:MAG: N-6 DNA methylase [bacterium]|nr:N-6 DNA methylase [bacterium]
MNRETCYKIIKDTLQSGFDKERFNFFIKNLLNAIDESKAFHARGHVREQFKQTAGIIKTYERIGTYSDPEEKKIDILIVYLEKENSIDRARTTLRNFVADYLKQRGQKDAALVAFVSPSFDDWRFSLIKMDYKFEESKSGKVKVKEEFTPARRWSFLVGAKENCHTAQSRLAPLIEDDSLNLNLHQLEEAFNIEKVTKEFFEKYRELFLILKDNLDKMVAKDSKIKNDFQEKDIDTIDFAKKLLGQIVFLYFLQKKGWFGVERDSNWGTGPKDFLRQLFKGNHGDYKNFFNEILEPLFYEALARERDDNYYGRFNCKIPFLNGGLFDPIGNYDWVHTDILLENELFSNENKDLKTGDVGDGILDIFDRYNFTVREDEPLEKEVAVDPEMLGKVFENLLEVKDRKSKGTYYTPREIVHYMCEQSLINYLATELPNIGKEDVEEYIKIGDQVLENEYWVALSGESGTKKFKISPTIIANAESIDKKLADIKVCDPAIGSGAFPVGMMNEIVNGRIALNPYINQKENRTAYDFKNEAITNSLYGVDIDPGAVEIAKLRLWLSLVVDEDDIHHIKPLPNLDYKIMQGNSLLEEFEGIKLFDEKIIPQDKADKEARVRSANEKISELQREYIKLHSSGNLSKINEQLIKQQIKDHQKIIANQEIKPKTSNNIDLFKQYDETKRKWDELTELHKNIINESNRDDKNIMLNRASELEWEFIEVTLKREGKFNSLKKVEQFRKNKAKPFFLWRLHFSDVFKIKNGFDIVIANPPYVNVFELDKDKEFDKKIYRDKYKSASGAFDLYILFHEWCIDLAKQDGVITLISPNKYLSAEYAQKLREFIVNNATFVNLVDLSSIKVFDASVYPIVSIYQKFLTNYPIQVLKGSGEVGNIQILGNNVYQQDQMKTSPKLIWSFLLSGSSGLYQKINSHHKITDVCNVTASFSVDEAYKIKKLVYNAEQQNSQLPCKKLIISSNIYRYYVLWGKGSVSYLKDRFQKPFVALDPNILSQHRLDQINNEKIIIAGMTKELRAFLDSNGEFVAGIPTVLLTNFKTDSRYLLGLINSKLYNFYFHLLFGSLSLAGGYLRIGVPQINSLPFIESSAKDKNLIISLTESILLITSSSDYSESIAKQSQVKEYEHQIDQMVYKLYDLTLEEIEVVKGTIKNE